MDSRRCLVGDGWDGRINVVMTGEWQMLAGLTQETDGSDWGRGSRKSIRDGIKIVKGSGRSWKSPGGPKSVPAGEWMSSSRSRAYQLCT